MYSTLNIGSRFLRYRLTALNGKGHGIHSPFVFQFVTKVMNVNTHRKDYDVVEKLRKEMLKDQTMLTIEDLGAGSSISKSNERTVASIAKSAAKSKKYAQLLYRMVKKYQPETILELGTSLGITTSYLSLAKPDSRLITLEGAGSIAQIAETNFQNLGLRNVELIRGNFDDTLLTALGKLQSVDFCFIDGNHRKEPTERYFRELLPYLNSHSIVVLDDIHWSREMEEAWTTIVEHESVRCSIDLFFVGIVFLRKEFKEKQHFVIKF